MEFKLPINITIVGINALTGHDISTVHFKNYGFLLGSNGYTGV